MEETNDIEVLRSFLEVPLYNSDAIFKRFLQLPDREIIFRGTRPARFLYIRGQRTNRILLVAHADTVWDDPSSKNAGIKPELLLSNGVFQSANRIRGIGADDRAGCAILWLLKDLGHSLLITDGEEKGGIGSKWLMNDTENADIAEEINTEH